MEDIYDETQKELEQEKNEKFIWSLVKILAIASVIFLFFFAIYSYVELQNKSLVEKDSEFFIKALMLKDQNQKDLALEELRKVTNSPNYKALAQLEIAKIYVSKNEMQKAQEIFQILLNDSKIDPFLSNLAKIYSLSFNLKSDETEKIFAKENSPFYVSILYSKLLAEVGDNKFDNAAITLDKIKLYPKFNEINSDNISLIEQFLNQMKAQK